MTMVMYYSNLCLQIPLTSSTNAEGKYINGGAIIHQAPLYTCNPMAAYLRQAIILTHGFTHHPVAVLAVSYKSWIGTAMCCGATSFRTPCRFRITISTQ